MQINNSVELAAKNTNYMKLKDLLIVERVRIKGQILQYNITKVEVKRTAQYNYSKKFSFFKKLIQVLEWM